MGKEVDIFKNLKNWDIKPPKHLFKKIWKALSKPQQSKDLSHTFVNFETAKNNEEEYSNNELEAFRSLQNHSITPPSFSSLKIRDLVVEKTTRPTTKVFQLKYFIRATAAILIIAIGLWFVYTKPLKNDSNKAVVNSSQKNLPVAATNSILAISSKPVISSSPKKTGLIVAAKNNARDYGKQTNGYQHLTTNNQAEGLLNNDILATLVNYNYSEYLPLLAEIKKNNKITIDRFSYVNVSDKMNTILQTMYTTKGNNKPTRKARKLRATMEKWKKRDEKHFDASIHSNPLDIIDLSEFILK